ncbi:MAG: hypothetical protein EA426_08790 [Spirochaetaceae bacterium]|nr:MAG: hypothetical protein EA426_08790 [Spirochaetaceae bacterium]
MENSTFRFVAVSMAVVFLFSCATLDDEAPEARETEESIGESLEHEPDVALVSPELPEAQTEALSTPALPELPIEIRAVRIDDDLPRMIPLDTETLASAVPLPLPEPPAATVGPEIGEAPPGPTPTPTPMPTPPEAAPAPTVSEGASADGSDAAADEAAAVVVDPVPEPEPVPPAVPPTSAPQVVETPRTDPDPSFDPRVAAVPTPPEPTAEEPREGATMPVDVAQSDRRDIETGVMTEVNVVFPGFGWVYAGAESGGTGRVEFLRSERTDDGTVFVFRMTEAGRYTLSFQRQDLARGEFVDEAIAVTAREDQTVVDAEGTSLARDRSAGETTETEEPAVPTIDSQSPDDLPRSTAAGPSVDPRIVFDNALVDGDADRAVAAVRDIPIEMVGGADVVRLARLLDQSGDVGGAIEFYELALSREPLGTDMAEILFALGSLYERESDRRSIRRSHGYYERVVTEYPFSRLRDAARRRAAYLERYFLTVR